MKRRLRKKKRIGEFQELGFELGFEIAESLTPERRNALLDAFILHAVEANGLQFGGGGDSVWRGFATLSKSRGSATEEHRLAVRDWLDTNPDIRNAWVGELRDAWYGWADE